MPVRRSRTTDSSSSTKNTYCTRPPAAEEVIQDFLADGWLDGTAGFNGITHEVALVVRQRLDWIFYRGLTVMPGSTATDACGSDHCPVYRDVIW